MRQLLGVVAGLLALAIPVALLFGPRWRDRATPPIVDPARRSFLNHVLIGSLALFAVAFGGASIAVLWPEPRRGFGTKIVAGRLDDLRARIEETGPVYNVDGRFYLVPYDVSDPDNMYLRAGVVAGGLMALFQKCSHLGCRVPFCPSSQWFECPCHDARFNLAGEVRNGPAPAGLWRFPVEISPQGDVIVDTSHPKAQPPMGTDTTSQQAAGPFCVK
jgi:cytochrome b6-f complex iron-sulfur subunit